MEAVFTKLEMNNVNFLQNNPFGIQYTYSSRFCIGWSIYEAIFFI